ncbi:hypothetical protein [Vibrio spartinae]|uniref:Uncharacterized protein n=1 Tax=Vibrio spartinae TaxID=1918945 RepID=A0A1N6LZB8_9VIBR|nr:hypothetical protein [Vibrio spartinae]SIO92524.1 hypothetical protein VSP9026_00137 [Vibrio spartinae]
MIFKISLQRIDGQFISGQMDQEIGKLWKTVENGADGYLLSMVGDFPYWSDAIGQIPFAIDTYRLENDIQKVVDKGKEYGNGGIFFKEADNSNEYDNYLVLRGALFASQKYTYEIVHGEHFWEFDEKIETVTDYSPDNLGTVINAEQKEKYL